MNMKLPAYPVATIDPHFSLWVKKNTINESDTCLWCGHKKRIEGTLTVDGQAYSFLGRGEGKRLVQKEADITPYVSTYIFEGEGFSFKFATWSPFLFDDFHILSLPCAFFDSEIKFEDRKKHTVSVSFVANKELCYDKKKKVVKYTLKTGATKISKMGVVDQRPLNDSGDSFAADWGYYCLASDGAFCVADGIGTESTKSAARKISFTAVVGYDDIYSINYFGEKLKGLWTEKFSGIEEAMAFCLENHDELFERVRAQEKMILDDSREFGEDYQKILCAAARQVLAGHKLVRNGEGELLYLSKEHHSNGCINTVDVSYPALPMFLLYAPELVKAMMTGIFRFAHSKLWKEDFAPHDIGRYPFACGQVYALQPWIYTVPRSYSFKRIYKLRGNIYMPQFQMPVEECGNMLMMAYTYYIVSGDKAFLERYFETLEKWATYLKNKGVILDNQLCTDDFAGHSKKNVNLAIKGIMGLAAFGEIGKALGKENDSRKVAQSFALQLLSACDYSEGHLPFSVDKKESWSLKYNLVWDKLPAFGIFEKALYKGESEKYKKELNEYGVPLDYRKDFTKTDWMLWAACLDESGENIERFSKAIVKYLENTKDRNCFSDWTETKKAEQRGFDHRTVQAGLWMPVLAKKLFCE